MNPVVTRVNIKAASSAPTCMDVLILETVVKMFQNPFLGGGQEQRNEKKRKRRGGHEGYKREVDRSRDLHVSEGCPASG